MPRLRQLQIELVGVCNVDCNYCTWQQRKLGKQKMDSSMAMAIIVEAHQMGVERVFYHGLGESTLHPDLADILNFAGPQGFYNCLSTNCTKLEGKLADALAKMDFLTLILAVPWVVRESMVSLAVENVKNYLALKPCNQKIYVQMVCAEGAEPHYDRMVREFLPAVEPLDNAVLFFKQPLTWPNDTPNKGFIRPDLMKHPKVITDVWPTPISIATGCDMPNNFLMILADGTVTPCCVSTEDWGIGRLDGDTMLREVWESTNMERVRDLWRAGADSVPCGNCKNRKDCITSSSEARLKQHQLLVQLGAPLPPDPTEPLPTEQPRPVSV